jgi:hypothetical protein
MLIFLVDLWIKYLNLVKHKTNFEIVFGHIARVLRMCNMPPDMSCVRWSPLRILGIRGHLRPVRGPSPTHKALITTKVPLLRGREDEELFRYKMFSSCALHKVKPLGESILKTWSCIKVSRLRVRMLWRRTPNSCRMPSQIACLSQRKNYSL